MSKRFEPRPPTITEEVYLACIKTHVARIEALEAALREIIDLRFAPSLGFAEAARIARAALIPEQDK